MFGSLLPVVQRHELFAQKVNGLVRVAQMTISHTQSVATSAGGAHIVAIAADRRQLSTAHSEMFTSASGSASSASDFA